MGYGGPAGGMGYGGPAGGYGGVGVGPGGLGLGAALPLGDRDNGYANGYGYAPSYASGYSGVNDYANDRYGYAVNPGLGYTPGLANHGDYYDDFGENENRGRTDEYYEDGYGPGYGYGYAAPAYRGYYSDGWYDRDALGTYFDGDE